MPAHGLQFIFLPKATLMHSHSWMIPGMYLILRFFDPRSLYKYKFKSLRKAFICGLFMPQGFYPPFHPPATSTPVYEGRIWMLICGLFNACECGFCQRKKTLYGSKLRHRDRSCISNLEDEIIKGTLTRSCLEETG